MNFIQSTDNSFFATSDAPRFSQFQNDTVTQHGLRATIMTVQGKSRITQTVSAPFERVIKLGVSHTFFLIFGIEKEIEPIQETISMPFPGGLPQDTAIEKFSRHSSFVEICSKARGSLGPVTNRTIYRTENDRHDKIRHALCSTLAVHCKSISDLIVIKVDLSDIYQEILYALSAPHDAQKTMWKASHWTHKKIPIEARCMITITCQQGLFIIVGPISQLRQLQQLSFQQSCFMRDFGCWFPEVRPRHGIMQNMDGVLCHIGHYEKHITENRLAKRQDDKRIYF